MDIFPKSFNYQTLISHFMSELIDELGFKLKNSVKNRVPEKKMFAKRKKTETLDVEERPRLSKSVSFDSIASRFSVVNIENDVRNMSFVDSSLTRYPSVEETSDITDKPVNSVEENVEEMGEIIDKSEKSVDKYDKDDEFEDEKNVWSLKVLLKWLIVMIVLILTTLMISAVGSPMPSPVRESIRGCMYLFSKTQTDAGIKFREVVKAISARNYDYEVWDKKDLGVNSDGLVEMQHEQIEDFWDYEMESEGEGSEEMEKDVGLDDIWGNMHSERFQESKTEDKNEINGLFLLIDSDEVVARKKDVVEKEENNNDGLYGNETERVKPLKFDLAFSAFIGFSLLTFASSVVLYYSNQTKISSLVETPKNEVSNQSGAITSFDQSTRDSQCHGSFTIEQIIVKKQKSKTPESTISKVRRLSRIHNRSVTPSP